MRRRAMRLGLGMALLAVVLLAGIVLLRGPVPIAYESIRFADSSKVNRGETIHLRAFVAGALPLHVQLKEDDQSYFRDIRAGLMGITMGKTDPCVQHISDAGVIALGPYRHDHVFAVGHSGGTGYTMTSLFLFDPLGDELYRYDLGRPHSAAVRLSDVYMNDALAALPADAPQRKFFEAVRRRYGYLDETDIEKNRDNPDWAYYFWYRQHGGRTDISMQVRWFAGPPTCPAGHTDSMMIGSQVFIAQFKCGVVLYDTAGDRHCVLFHPGDPYSWATALEEYNGYLLIGTRGVGLWAVNLNTMHLRKLDAGDRIIESIAILPDGVRVNGERMVAFPDF